MPGTMACNSLLHIEVKWEVLIIILFYFIFDTHS